MSNIEELMIMHKKLLEKVIEDIQINGIVMDSQQLQSIGMLSRSKSFIEGYRQGYKDAQEESENKS